MSAAKYDFLTVFCQTFLLFLIFAYFIIILSITSSEIDAFKDLHNRVSEYSSEDKKALTHSVIATYEKLKYNPINSILLINNGSCPLNYEILPIYFWNTKTVCVCPYNSQFVVGECKNYISKDCYTSEERELDLFTWRGNQICIKRNNDFYVKNPQDACKAEYILCSNNVCVLGKSSDLCPITSIIIQKKLNNQSLENPTPQNHTFLSGMNDNNFNFYISRSVEKDYISFLQVEMNGSPCIYELESPIRKEFPLLRANPNGCAKYKNDNGIFKLIDFQNEWDFYLNNNLNVIAEDIKNMQSYSINNAMLYSGTKIKIKCKDIPGRINTNDTEYPALEAIRDTGDSISIILSCVGLVLFFIHVFGIVYYKTMCDSLFLGIYCLIFIFFEGLITPISLYYFRKTIDQNEMLYKIHKSACFEIDGYNKMFNDLESIIFVSNEKINNILYSILFFSLIIFIIDTLYIIDKLVYNFFFDNESKGILEDSEFISSCNCDCDDCDCVL